MNLESSTHSSSLTEYKVFNNIVNNNWWKSFSVGTLDMQFQVF